jgi:protein-S-isoprenylcysteine O-methyltransferase Ste14
MAVMMGILWGLYYALHSVYAATPVKAWFKRQIPTVYPYYRFIYSTFATVGLLYVGWLQLVIPKQAIWEGHESFPILGTMVLGLGGLLCFGALRNYKLKEFMGISQVEYKGDLPKDELKTSGFNGIVRHPLYLSLIVFFVGYLGINFFVEDLVFVLVTIGYIAVGTFFEEKKLMALYGNEYADYKAKTYRLIPYLW